jgi:hypothetical protein
MIDTLHGLKPGACVPLEFGSLSLATESRPHQPIGKEILEFISDTFPPYK